MDAVVELTDCLTRLEKRRLTIWKWRYSLESAGLTQEEAARLVFLKWRVKTGKLPVHS